MKRPRHGSARRLFPILAIALGSGSCVAGCAPGGDPLKEAKAARDAGRGQEAWQLAAAAAAADSTSADALILLAETCLLTLRTTPGVAAAGRALELAPDDARTHFVKAFLDQARFLNVAAVAAAGEAVRLAPGHARYHVGLGELRLGGGMVGTAEYGAAAESFRSALRLDPENLRALFGLGKTLVLAGDPEGEEVLEEFLGRRPVHGEARYLRGVARLRRRDLDGAEEDFRAAAFLDPSMPSTYFNLARVLQMKREVREAEAVHQRYAALRELDERIRGLEITYHSDTNNAGAGRQLAVLYGEAGRFDEAVALLETLCVDDPRAPVGHVLLAEAALAAGHVELARRSALRAVEMGRWNPRAHVVAARAAREVDAMDEAVRYAREAVRLAPDETAPELLLGNLLITEGDADEAVRLLETAWRRAPGDLRVAGSIGRALVTARRSQEGERVLTNALTATPRNPEWLHWRGVARVEQNKVGWAKDDFRAAIANGRGRPESYESLADLLERSGEKGEARKLRKQAMEVRRWREEMERARKEWEAAPYDVAAGERFAAWLEKLGRADADVFRARATRFRGLP